MKVKAENQLGLNFSQKIKDEFYRLQNDKYFNPRAKEFGDEAIEPFRVQWKDILSDNGNKNLFFTKTSRDVADSIKVGKFEAKVLKVKQDRKLTFLIDDTHFYRVCLRKDEILVLIVKSVPSSAGMFYWSYDSIKIKPLLNEVHYPSCPTDYLDDKYFSEFLKLLIFVEYSELEETILKPNQSIGTKKQGKYFNATTQPFVIVDSQWNKIIVRKEGFGVSGHLRWQPVGTNREDRKLIYIAEFVKNGYVRGAKKNQIDNQQ